MNSKLRPLYLAVASVMPVAAMGDAIIPETNKQNAPTMNQSANGTPVVNITDPNQRGISHNKYSEFNVNQQGVIFNNSMADGVSKIGGHTMKNTQLNKEANVILNEVTGAKGTHLNGTMEVFGRKADVIIANENGIKVNGVATVNTNNLTLTTGKVVPQNDGRILLNVEKGGVDIEGRGISTDGLGYFDIISRTVKLDGEIAGQAETKVVTGLNDYDPETRTHTVRSTTGEDRPEVAIDGSALGSMYGGRIQLISTESGVGVRHQGSLVGTRGVEISANGDLMLSGIQSDQGNVTLAGNTISVQKHDGYGGIASQGDLVIRALSHLMLGADAVSEQGTIRIDAGSMLQSAAVLMAKNGQSSTGNIPSIIINVNDEYQIAGNLYAVDAQGNRLNNATITLEKGAYVVRVGGQVVNAGVTSDAQLVAQQGDISVNAKKFKNNKGGVVARKGAITFNITDVAENDGTIQAAGSFFLNTGKAKNSGIIYADTQRFTVGSLENQGAMFANNVIVETGALDNSGVINANADITLKANGDLVNNSGDIQGKNVAIEQNGTTAGSAKMTNTGKVQAADALRIKTDTLDNSGKLYSGKEMNLALTDALNLHQGSETTAYGDLTVIGAEERKLNITNDGGWLQGNNIHLNGLDTLTNQNNGTIITSNTFDLKNSNTLLNDSGLIQGNNVVLDNINTVTNQNDSTILAGDSLSMTQVKDLTNAQSTLSATNALVMDGVENIVNQKGLISAGTSLDISNAVQLRNIDSSTIQSQGALNIDNVGLLKNENASGMLSINDALTLSDIGVLSNDATSQILSAAQIAIVNIDTLANQGVIQANEAVMLKGINRLVNSGETALIASIEQLTLQAIAELTNADGAYISGGTAAVLEQIGKLINSKAIIQSAGDVSISADTMENIGTDTDEGTGVLADDSMELLIADELVNTGGAALVANNRLDIITDTLSNTKGDHLMGGQISAGEVNLLTNTLDNRHGAIQAYENLILNINKILKNHEGTLWSDHSLELNIKGDFTLRDIADSNPDDNVDDSDNSGTINARNKLAINTTGDLQIDSALESRGEIHLNAEGDLTNNHAIISNQDIYLTGTNVTNSENSLIWSMDDLNIDAKEGTFTNGYNGNVLSMSDISIVAENLINDVGIIRSEGNMNLDAQVIENRSKYSGDKWDYGPTQQGTASITGDEGMKYLEWKMWTDLPILSSDIELVKAGEISSGGHMFINQKDLFTNSAEKPMSVKNDGGIIQSKGSMFITGDLYNTPRYVDMSMHDYLHHQLATPIKISFYWRSVGDGTRTALFDTLHGLLDYLLGSGEPSDYKDDDASWSWWQDANRPKFVDVMRKTAAGTPNSSAQLNDIMIRLFGESWITKDYADLKSDWAKLNGESEKQLKEKKQYFLPSDKGSIVSGGDFVHDGGSLNNGIDDVEIKTGKDENVVVEKVGEQEVDAIDAGYEIDVNLKKVEELRGGISTLPTLAELINIPGMFATSTEWNTRNSDDKAVKTDPDSKVVPMYETRTSLINQDDYFGSEYFFEQVGYDPAQPAMVIGDNYFISELIRRQLNQSVGTFFSVRDGVEGADLVQMLMNNARQASDDAFMGLEVGKPLTDEQKANLDQDIVWFVNQNIDGTDVLVPMVYLSAKTIEQMETGVQEGAGSAVIHANNNVITDATEVNNNNGVISAGKSVVIQSKGDINNVSRGMNSGIKAGESIIAVSTDGSINNDGAAMKAGQDILMSAENGEINITASVGRDVTGKQEIHRYDDAISAGGSIGMQAKDITVNAGTITAGKDIGMKATEGDVKFNEMHEISAEYKQSSDFGGALNFESTETKNTQATSKQSHISAGNNMVIDAANDIVMEGGEYTAKAGKFNAGNDILIKTAQDHAYSETKHVKEEFSISGKVSGGGYTAEGEYSNRDGASSHTDGGNYENVNDTDTASPGSRKPGKAPVAPMVEVKAGYSSLKEESTAQSTTNKNAQFNFDEQLDMTAGKTLDIGGADIKSKGLVNLTAEELASTKYEDTLETTYSKEEMFIGVKNQSGSVIADVLDKNAAMVVNKVNNPDVGFDPAMTALQVAGDASNLYFNDLASSTTTWGVSKNSTSGSTSSSKENITHIEAGQLNIKTKNDAALNGVDIKADGVNMDIGGDLSVRAAEAKTSFKEKSKGFEVGISSGVAVDKDTVGMGASLDVSAHGGKSSGDTKSYANSSIAAKDVKIKTGGDMTLDGSNIDADTADIETGGKLNIISRQDTVNTDASSWHAGVSVGVAVTTDSKMMPIPTFGVNAGGGSEYHDEAKTNKQAGIHTKGELNVKSGDDINMTGAHIISDSKTGTVETKGKINATELIDKVEQDGAYGGGGGGITKTGVSVNGYVETVDEVHFNETQHSTISVGDVVGEVNGKLNKDGSQTSTITKDEKEWGNDISFSFGTGGGGKKKPDAASPPKRPDSARPAPRPDDARPAPRPDDVKPQPKPDDVKPQPQPKPDDVKPQPQPKPDDVKPQPQPKPDDVKPQPQPKPDDVKPQPQPEPDDVKPQPQPKPDDNQPKPDDNQPKPDDNQPKPDDNQPKPDDNQPKPDDNQPKPDDNQPKPDGTDGDETIDPAKPGRPGEYNGKHWEVKMPDRVILTPGSATGKTEWIEPPRDGNTNNGTPYEGVPRSGSTIPRVADIKPADSTPAADPSQYNGKHWDVKTPDPVILTPGSNTNNIKDHDTPRDGNTNNGTEYEGQGKIIHDPNGTAKNISETTGLNGDPSQYDGKHWDVKTPEPVVLTPGSNTNNVQDNATPRDGNTSNGTAYEGQGKVVHDPDGTAKNIAETTGLNGDPSQYDGKSWGVEEPAPVVLTPGSGTNNVQDNATPRDGNTNNGTAYEGQPKLVKGSVRKMPAATATDAEPKTTVTSAENSGAQSNLVKGAVRNTAAVTTKVAPGENGGGVQPKPIATGEGQGAEIRGPEAASAGTIHLDIASKAKGLIEPMDKGHGVQPKPIATGEGQGVEIRGPEGASAGNMGLTIEPKAKGLIEPMDKGHGVQPKPIATGEGQGVEIRGPEGASAGTIHLDIASKAKGLIEPMDKGHGVQPKPIATGEGQGVEIRGPEAASAGNMGLTIEPKAKGLIEPMDKGHGVQPKPIATGEGQGVEIRGPEGASAGTIHLDIASKAKGLIEPMDKGHGVQPKPIATGEGQGAEIRGPEAASAGTIHLDIASKAKGLIEPMDKGHGVQPKPIATGEGQGVEIRGPEAASTGNMGLTIEPKAKGLIVPGQNGGGVQPKPASQFEGKVISAPEMNGSAASAGNMTISKGAWQPLLPEYSLSAKQTYQNAEWSQANTFSNNKKG
ncbi:hemagglutinin repeat-containing protein [Chimaeribacter arupi]|nr:hemagglutinin repeat-containing protein [Chimaeribacter arupi]